MDPTTRRTTRSSASTVVNKTITNVGRKRKVLGNVENKVESRQNLKLLPGNKIPAVNGQNRKVLANLENSILPMRKPLIKPATTKVVKVQPSKLVARVAPFKVKVQPPTMQPPTAQFQPPAIKAQAASVQRWLQALPQAILPLVLETQPPTVCEQVQLPQSPVPMEIGDPEVHATDLSEAVQTSDSGYFDPNLYEEYAPFVYSYLRGLESDFAIPVNFLEHQSEVTYRMREVLVDWLKEVSEGYDLLLETFYTAVGLIDMYLTHHNVPRNRFQLLGIAALFLASKYEEVSPPEIRDFVYITDNYCSKIKILNMEFKILKTLKFRLGRPLAITFLRRITSAAGLSKFKHTISKYFLELSLLDHQLCYLAPSMLASVACYLALKMVSENSWSEDFVRLTGYTDTELFPAVKRLAKRISVAHTFHVSGIYSNYCSGRNLKIATLPELRTCESVL